MQVYQKAGLHKYMYMYGKVAQCIIMSLAHHIIFISTHIYVYRSRMMNNEPDCSIPPTLSHTYCSHL